ncbi:hypothetical protein Hdeb2414_s0033g00724591 [Helianthus debilis subsp. tardiflorus]
MLVGKSITIDNHVNAFSTMHGRAIVVRMCNLEALKNIYVILNDICPGLGKVRYLGGLDMLISFEDSETAASILEEAKLVNDRFSMISLWEGQSLGFERLAWLKVQGIPLHLLTKDVINVVGGMFGKVVHKANRSEDDADLLFEYVGVLVGDGKKVSEEIILNWNNWKFRVWIMEELDDWVPDFYEVKHVEEDTSLADDVDNAADDVDETEDANDEQMPEFQPVNPAGDEDNVISNVVPINLESNNCINDDNNECQSTPMIDRNLNSDVSIKDFVPAVNFDFDLLNADDNVGAPVSNVADPVHLILAVMKV